MRPGTFVRIAPNNISIADPDALPVVYGHGTGTVKSSFYDSFVGSASLFVALSADLARLQRPRPLQHARSGRAHPQAQDRLARLQPEERARVRALVSAHRPAPILLELSLVPVTELGDAVLTSRSIDEVVVRFLAMWDRHCDNAKKTACVQAVHAPADRSARAGGSATSSTTSTSSPST